MSEREIFAAYLAGFIDGEGHLQILEIHKKYPVPRIRITNTDKNVLDYISKELKYGKVKSYDQKANKLAKKKIYVLEITKVENVIECLKLCGKYLIIKNKRGKELLKVANEVLVKRQIKINKLSILSSNIKDDRNKFKLSYVKLSKKYNISYGTVYNILNEKVQYAR